MARQLKSIGSTEQSAALHALTQGRHNDSPKASWSLLDQGDQSRHFHLRSVVVGESTHPYPKGQVCSGRN